jgi:hypothetical protein
MIKYKRNGTQTIDNLTDALELLGRNEIWVTITNKAKKDPYGDKLRKAFFGEIKND